MSRSEAIYDCHVNVWEADHFDRSYFEQLGRVRSGDVQDVRSSEETYAAMDKVRKAILFSPRYRDSVGVQGSDETVAKIVAKYPDKFVGFAYVDPREPDCLESLKHSVETLGMSGVKYGPIYNGVPLDDPRLAPIFAYCQKEDLPITLHMGTTYARNAPVELGRPIHVEPVAMKYPDLKLVMAHLGHPWTGECIAVSRKQPNVYMEISALFYRPWQFYNNLIACEEYRVIDKVFFGTDYPFTTVDESIEGLLQVNRFTDGTQLPKVSDESIRAILHSNPFDHWWHDRN